MNSRVLKIQVITRRGECDPNEPHFLQFGRFGATSLRYWFCRARRSFVKPGSDSFDVERAFTTAEIEVDA